MGKMKSLEFINGKIKQIKKDLYKLGETKEGTAKDFGKYVLTEELKDYQDVKQDLEVLKILKKYSFFDEYEFFYKNGKRCDCIRLLIHSTRMKEEEYKKLKKWLEEQE